MYVTFKGRCMGDLFQCDTGEILPLRHYLKDSTKSCFINGYFVNDMLVIIKILWIYPKKNLVIKP